VVVRGSLGARTFLAFYLEQDRLKAAVGMNRGGDPETDAEGELAKARRLIAAGGRLVVQDLADEGLDIESIRALD
jgi:hypothetical protein